MHATEKSARTRQVSPAKCRITAYERQKMAEMKPTNDDEDMYKWEKQDDRPEKLQERIRACCTVLYFFILPLLPHFEKSRKKNFLFSNKE